MSKLVIKTAAVIGLGLIGGSYAKALRTRTDVTVWGYDLDGGVQDTALRTGVIEAAATPARLSEADLVLVCLYPEAAGRYITEHAPLFKKGALVTDACGVKTPLCAGLEAAAAQHGFHFIGSHPMAGKERGGLQNADGALFEGASFLMTPSAQADQDAAEALAALAADLGFGRVVRCTPEEHDRMIAFTSQLPHVLACAYVHSPRCTRQADFSAGSYRDVSRVACINEEMWSSLFLLNRAPLCEEIDLLTAHLQELRGLIARGDREGLSEKLKSGREIKEGYGA